MAGQPLRSAPNPTPRQLPLRRRRCCLPAPRPQLRLAPDPAGLQVQPALGPWAGVLLLALPPALRRARAPSAARQRRKRLRAAPAAVSKGRRRCPARWRDASAASARHSTVGMVAGGGWGWGCGGMTGCSREGRRTLSVRLSLSNSRNCTNCAFSSGSGTPDKSAASPWSTRHSICKVTRVVVGQRSPPAGKLPSQLARPALPHPPFTRAVCTQTSRKSFLTAG